MIVVFALGICGRLPALTAWWCLDDWGQLARAAGYLPAPDEMPARWLSQHAWWSLVWPLLGLNAIAHAWTRIVLHSLAAVGIVRLAKRASLAPFAQLLAGVLFAASPVAFTPLYWASGIQELLGGVLAIWAAERWCAPQRRDVLIAGLLGVGAVLSKESALAFPVLLCGWLLSNRGCQINHRRVRWTVASGLLLAAIFEAVIVARHFATGPSDHYATGGFLVMLGNLGKFGWWLPTPIHFFTAQMTWPKATLGLMLLALWGVGGMLDWRRGRRLPLLAWCCAIASLAPALPLVNQARPYMAYVAAACGALTVACWVPDRGRHSRVLVIAIALAAVVWSQATMRGRIGRLDGNGVPADPIVRATLVSRESADQLKAALDSIEERDKTLSIFQLQMSTPADAVARPLAVGPAARTPGYAALEGSMGASLLYGHDTIVEWTSSLLATPAGNVVVCEKAQGFQVWGETREALCYAATLYIVANRYDDAIENLARARELGGGRPLKYPVANRIGLPVGAIAAVSKRFDRHLIAMAIEKRISGEDYLAFSGFLESE